MSFYEKPFYETAFNKKKFWRKISQRYEMAWTKMAFIETVFDVAPCKIKWFEMKRLSQLSKKHLSK